jgi:hypothetical protein
VLPLIQAVVHQERNGGVFKIPVAAAEHRSPPRGIREPFDRARGALCAPGELGERRGGREAQEGVGGAGVCFFWLLLARAIPGAGPAGALCAPNFAPGKIVFAQAKTNSTGSNLDSRRRPEGRGPGMVRVQSNLPWVSHPQVVSHHRRRRYKKRLDSRLRGNDGNVSSA